MRTLAERYGINPKAVVKWEKRAFVGYAPVGPKIVRSSVLGSEQKAIIVFLANRRSWCWIIVLRAANHRSTSKLIGLISLLITWHQLSTGQEADKPSKKTFKSKACKTTVSA